MEADNNYQVFLSSKAAEKIKDQLASRGTPQAYLRLGVKGSGCSGYSYVFEFEDSPPRARDIVFDIEDVHIIVDKKSIIYLDGSTLVWEETLMNQSFKLNNPNEKSTCGCGHSFTV